MRIVFAGTPAAAVPTLRALAEGPHDVVAVVTRPDAPLGRKRVLTPSPVGAAADDLGMAVLKTARLNAEATDRIAAFRPDLGVIVAYGGLVREPLLSTPAHGWINLHFSLLPRWRGAAPVQRAIMAGDRVTGAAVFQLVAELDAGAVFDSLEREIGPDETTDELLHDLAHAGAPLVTRVVDAIADGSATATAQTGTVSTAAKLTLDDARLDFGRPAREVYARFRGVTSEPGGFFVLDGQRVKVLGATLATGDADEPPLPPGELALIGGRAFVGTATRPLHLVTVQPAGKRAMPGGDWLRGLAAHRRVQVAS